MHRCIIPTIDVSNGITCSLIDQISKLELGRWWLISQIALTVLFIFTKNKKENNPKVEEKNLIKIAAFLRRF